MILGSIDCLVFCAPPWENINLYDTPFALSLSVMMMNESVNVVDDDDLWFHMHYRNLFVTINDGQQSTIPECEETSGNSPSTIYIYTHTYV